MKLTRPIILAAVLVIALLGAATAVIVAHASSTQKTTTINVTEKGFHLGLSSHKAPAGPVRFVIKNTGNYIHAFAIAGPGVKTKPIVGIEPGTTHTMLVTLRSGRYLIWCTMPGHATNGMRTSITVPGATADTTPSTTTTTDTTGDTTTSEPIPGY
jgi:uncharacterized cupredoxin-like copper-binding protein